MAITKNGESLRDVTDRLDTLDATYVNVSGDTMTGNLNVVSPTNAGTTGVRQITVSTSDPTNSDGANGDIWLKYI